MSTITTKDGTQLYYNDWGTGQPLVFSHGWPLSVEAFEGSDVLPGFARLPVHRARPPRPWPLESAVDWQRLGHDWQLPRRSIWTI
jgi:pimeloyl-ACP methyl ester carboxylesterase